MPVMERDYGKIIDDLSARLARVEGRTDRMQAVVDCLWEHLHDRGVSWVGFYTKVPGEDSMVLGPRRDKPACSPIGLHGACGQAYLRNEPLIVHDVKELGANYIACDPRDRSEIVIPVGDESGNACGVLDLDSYDVGAFNERDLKGLRSVLAAAKLL